MGSRRNDTYLFLVGEMRVGEMRVGEMRRHRSDFELALVSAVEDSHVV